MRLFLFCVAFLGRSDAAGALLVAAAFPMLFLMPLLFVAAVLFVVAVVAVAVAVAAFLSYPCLFLWGCRLFLLLSWRLTLPVLFTAHYSLLTAHCCCH